MYNVFTVLQYVDYLMGFNATFNNISVISWRLSYSRKFVILRQADITEILYCTFKHLKGRRGRDRMVAVFIAVPIITNVVSWNPVHGEVYSIQHYVMSVNCGRSVVFSGYFGFFHQ